MLRSFKFLLLALACDRGASFLPTNSLAGTTRTNLVELQASATAVQTKDVESLLASNRKTVDSLASVSEDVSEIERLRFAMGFDTPSEAEHALRKALSYRKGEGKSVIDAAQEAYETASIGGGWDNEVVRNSAPHASLINKYITSNNIVTVSTASGDLVYVIRASLIDDKKMMDNVSVQQLSDFFMYVKEIHSLVANQRSETNGRLCEVILANDITGVRKAPDSRFSKALSSSSSQYDKLYPTLAGPTMILNLPFILQAFVALFKPLFPKTVQAKLKFTKAPVLASMSELTPLATRGNVKNQLFMKEIDALLKK
jgi:hypothetical protein